MIDENDRWLVCAPVRTGGRFVTNLISEIYCNNDVMMTPIDGNSGERATTIEPGQVLHSHYVEDYIRFKNLDNIKTVILTRNAIDSVLSMMIANNIGKYHIYTHEDMHRIIPKKFYIDPNEVTHRFNNIKQFYTIIQANLSRETIVIRYEEILRGPLHVAQLLNIDNRVNDIIKKIKHNLPLKNKWNNSDWIDNYDEVIDTVTKLDRRILEY